MIVLDVNNNRHKFGKVIQRIHCARDEQNPIVRVTTVDISQTRRDPLKRPASHHVV